MNQESDLIIVLDNASIHHSSITLKNTLDIIFKIMFLPAIHLHWLLLNFSIE